MERAGGISKSSEKREDPSPYPSPRFDCAHRRRVQGEGINPDAIAIAMR